MPGGYDGRVCLLILLLVLGPRALIVVWWLLAPLQWAVAFGGGIVLPILGFLFLPWTTLVYVLVAPGGVVGLDWLWLVLAVLVDISAHAGAYGRRRRAVA
ncbi:hypothetical protein GCM10023200_36650 [Actinomycetospora chlora]|uniref:Uncharacterized protein n=1 Tax=Actinomycetospora chlora TaxID=663608 RepID=A0ABP9BPA8_9PSEU